MSHLPEFGDDLEGDSGVMLEYRDAPEDEGWTLDDFQVEYSITSDNQLIASIDGQMQMQIDPIEFIRDHWFGMMRNAPAGYISIATTATPAEVAEALRLGFSAEWVAEFLRVFDDGEKQWTTTPPKVPGWYWYRKCTRQIPNCQHIVHVGVHDGVMGVADLYRKKWNTIADFETSERLPNETEPSYWLGPLPIPEKPA